VRPAQLRAPTRRPLPVPTLPSPCGARPGRARFRGTQAETDIFEAAGHANPARHLPPAGRQRVPPAAVAAAQPGHRAPASFRLQPPAPARRGCCDDLAHRAAGREGRPGGKRHAFTPQVAHAQLDRVHAQRFGQFVDLHLGSEWPCGPRNTAKCAAGGVVGVDGAPDNFDVGIR
jgi:hypothetical protein